MGELKTILEFAVYNRSPIPHFQAESLESAALTRQDHPGKK